MTNNQPHIDVSQLYDLMDDYESTNSRTRQREIENKILEETVWQVREKDFVLSEADLRTLLDRVDDEDNVSRRILMRRFVNRL